MPIDYSKYPPNWKTEIVPRILNRDYRRIMRLVSQGYTPIEIATNSDDTATEVLWKMRVAREWLEGA